MSKKRKKKSWKEKQRERQVKQERAQETYRMRREREAERKPRRWPKGKILGAACVLVLIFGAYGVWQYTQLSHSEEPPPEPPVGGAIYIRADGQVDPSTASILNVGNLSYTFTADIQGSVVIERDNILVDGANHTLQGTGSFDSKGIDLTGRSNVTITHVRIADFDYGVYAYSASQNVLSQNDLTSSVCGICLNSSSYHNVSANSITDNELYGVYLYSASHNLLSSNDVVSNYYGICLEYSANYNTIHGNNVTDNQCGIWVYESSYNRNYYNSFIDNAAQVFSHASTNAWDDGYPSGGNHWSDYEEKYPDAEELDGSGIWNTPYKIDELNQDEYPLMNR